MWCTYYPQIKVYNKVKNIPSLIGRVVDAVAAEESSRVRDDDSDWPAVAKDISH